MFHRRTAKAKHSVDLSFLNSEEVSAVLEVLERDKKVRQVDDERLKQITKTNQDKLWLKGVTGQWFEEIRKAKFKDQTDLTKILNVPLTWSFRKKSRTALNDLKLTQSKSCLQSKNGISHIKTSDYSRGDDNPVSRPAASSESENQNTDSLSEQNQCSNHISLQLESPDMFQQLQVQLKATAVPRVERKIFVHRDSGKQILLKEHPKVLGQDLETKTISVAVNEQEKILGTEDLRNSGLQKKIIVEEGVKNYNHHGPARICRNDNKMNTLLNTSELSENAGVQSLPVGCNIENVNYTPPLSNVHAIEQQGNYCTWVETGQYKTDNAMLSHPASGLQSSIIPPKNMFQNNLINCADDILITHTDGYLSNSKRETARTSLLDLLTESRSLPVVADSNRNRQQSYSSNNICVSSQRDEGYSQSNSESSSFSSMMGPRSLNVGNKKVARQNLSDSLLNTSQKSGRSVFLQGSKSKAVSSFVPVRTPHSPLLSIYSNTRWNSNSLNCNNVTSQRGSISDSLQINQLKPSSSLSLPDSVCRTRATSYITIISKNKQQYSGSDNTNIATQRKCNDNHLQNCRDGRERNPLFSDSVTTEEFSSLNKTRMESATSRDADAPWPESKNDNWKQNCEDEGRTTFLLPTQLIGSQLPTCVTTCMNDNVLQTCAPNTTGAALQSGGDGYLQKVKHETGHELSADPKTPPQCPTNIIYYNNSIMQSNPPKTDAVTVESVNNDSLQNDKSETSSTTGMTITQTPNYAYKPLASQSSSNNNNLNLNGNSIQNYKQASVITPSTDQVLCYKFPIPYSYKYELLCHSTKSTGITANRTCNEYKSDPNNALPLLDSTEPSPSDTKNGMKNTLWNWPSHTVSSTLPEMPSVDNIPNYKSEMTSTPSSVVVMQHWSPTDFTHTNKGKSPKNYPNNGNNNNAQENKSETLPETVNNQQSSTTITHLNQDTSLAYSSVSGGNEYLPKDKSETNSKLSAQDSLTGQQSLTTIIDSSEEKSLTNFPLRDNSTMGPGTIKNAEYYQSEKNIPISSQDTLTGQQFPTTTHSTIDKSLIHSPLGLGVIKNLENYQSEIHRVVSLPDTTIGLKTPSDIKHGAKSTFQNWEQNSADITIIRGITKDYKQLDKSKIDIALSVLDPVSNQLSLTENTHCNEYKPLSHSLNSADVTGNRKSLGYLQNYKSEINTAVVSDKVTRQLSPTKIIYSKDKQLNDLPNSADIKREVKDFTQQDKSKTTYACSSLNPVTRQLSPINITHSNRYEPLSYSHSNSAITVDTGFNKHLQKENSEISSVGLSTDSLNSAADAVEHLQKDKSEFSGIDPSLDPLVVQQSPTDIKKSTLQRYSSKVTDICYDKGPCDRFKSEFLGKTNSASSSPPGMTSQWLTSNTIHSNQNKPLIHPLLSDDIHVDREGIEYLQKDKSESRDVDPSPEKLTGLQSTTTFTDTLQNYSSKVAEIAHDQKSCGIFTSKILHETNSVPLSPPPVTSQWLPTIVTHNKGHSNPHFPLSGDVMMNRECNEYLQKDNSELSTPDSLTHHQSPTNITHNNIDKSLAHSPFSDDISVGSGGVKNLENYQSENHSAMSPSRVTGQRTPTNITPGRRNTLQNLPPKNGDITFVRGISKDNVQHHKSETAYISSALESVIGRQFPKNIVHRSKYESLNYSPNSPAITVDRGGNEYLQKDKSEIHSVDTSLDPLTNLQSTAKITGTKKNTLQNYSSKVTEIYHVKPRDQFKLDFFHKMNSASSSPPALSSQWLHVGISHNNKGYSQPHSSLSGDIIMDRGGNEYLQKDNTEPALPDSLTDQQSPTNIYNKVKPLTHFPLSDDTTLGPGDLKNVENYQSEKSSPISSQDVLTGQQSLTNTQCNTDKPLTHSSKSGDIEVNENLQKYKPKISSVISSVYLLTHHHSIANDTDMKKNTLQHYTSKVTDIYHHKRPSDRFKLKDLHQVKNVPTSPAALTSQWLPVNTSHSNQDKPETHSLLRGDISLSPEGCKNVEKYQSEKDSAVSSTDKSNGQWTHTNITQDRKNTFQKRPPNIDDIAVDRGDNNVCDVQDKCETKCTPSPLNPVSSKLSPIDIAHSNEHKPLSHFLNSADVTVHRESPDYLQKYKHETKAALLSGDKVTQQKIPTDAMHSNKDKPLGHSSVSTDVNVSKKINKDFNQDKSKTSHVPPALDPVTSQQPSNNIIQSSKFKTLSYSPNSATVTADTGVNEHLQKDTPETNKIPTVDSLIDIQSITTFTDIKKNTRQNYSANVTEIYCDKTPYEKLKFKVLHKTNSAPSSPPKATNQWFTTNITHSNQEESLTHSSLSEEIIMDRRNNGDTQKNKSVTNNGFLSPISLAGQQSPTNIIKSKQAKSLAHSPIKDDFVMETADIKNVENCQSENNRRVSLQTPIGLWSSTDITCGKNTKFQNWSPNSDMSLNRRSGGNMKHCKSETDISFSLPDLLIDQEFSKDVTCSKKSNYLRESTKSGDITLDRRYNDRCEQNDKRVINSLSSSPDSVPTLLSPTNIRQNNRNVLRNHSPNSADMPPQDCNNAKEDDKIFRHGRKSFNGEMFQNRILGTWMKNTNVSNFLQKSSPEENQIDSDITEVNNFRNRLNACSDFSRNRGSSSSVDEDNNSPANNNYQAGTARFSKNYSRLTSCLMSSPQNTQSRYSRIYKAKSMKNINSDYNQSSLQDHENSFSTNIFHNSILTVQNRQFNPSYQFSNRIKSSRPYRPYSDLSFSNGNESDYNNWTSYHGSKFSLDNHELVIGNEDTRNVSKEEEEKKDIYLENMKIVLKADRLWKPGYLHKKASSPRSGDIFSPRTSGINQDPGVNDDNDDTVQNDEYFPVDIKIFWPKENPTDIIRLLSSSSTGSKISEDSLSPLQNRTPAVVDKEHVSRYSDTNSDTTTDDEYFLDGNGTVKESAL